MDDDDRLEIFKYMLRKFLICNHHLKISFANFADPDEIPHSVLTAIKFGKVLCVAVLSGSTLFGMEGSKIQHQPTK